MTDKPFGQRLRAFFEQLLTSRHVRFLEAELVRIRLEKDSQIRQLQADKIELNAKIDKLELAIWPTVSRAGQVYAGIGKPKESLPEIELPPMTHGEAVQQHLRKLAEEEAAEAKRKEN